MKALWVRHLESYLETRRYDDPKYIRPTRRHLTLAIGLECLLLFDSHSVDSDVWSSRKTSSLRDIRA